MESETSYIKGHLDETKASRSQVENATNDIEYNQSPSEHEKVWSQIGEHQKCRSGWIERLSFSHHPQAKIL